MENDLSLYFENTEARKQIGTMIEWLMLKKGFTRGKAARELHGQLGLSLASAQDYFGNVLMGLLYGISSERSIKRDPDKGRRRLAVVLSWLGITPEHDLVAAITKLDIGFHYSPDAYDSRKSAVAQPKSQEGGLEKRVDSATVSAPATVEAEVEVPQQYLPRERKAPSVAPLPQPVKKPVTVSAPTVAQSQPPVPLLDENGRKIYAYSKGYTPEGVHYYLGEKIVHGQFGVGVVVNSPLGRSEQPPNSASYTIGVMFKDKARKLTVNPQKLQKQA